MLKFFFSLFFLSCFFTGWAQEVPLTAEEKASLDSMFKNDEFFKMLNEKPDTSFVDVSIGVSNGVFSLKNNSLNAGQATTNKLFYTPSAGYFHKSGFAITVTGFLALDSNKLKFFQYGLNPSYGYNSKKINWGVSYTRYINGASTGFDINPFKNDLYGNVIFKKTWLRPAIGTGYSTGKIQEYFDSVITFIQVPRTITIRDTITTKLSSFSLNLSVSHVWSFKKLFARNDAMELQPSLILNGSNQKIVIRHSGSLNNRRPIVQKLLKAAYGNGRAKEQFSLQSAAFLLAATYGKGKLVARPQLYLDYYLHGKGSEKLTGLYSIMLSYAF
ncbi:MAG: hypothetical protein H7258_05020 [Ferruginibacter sp.]|nr:hypothetical protein [Ferruginibacter sp.]